MAAEPAAPVRALEVLVDGIVYGLSPFGGVVTFWDAVLPRLMARGVRVSFLPPPAARGPLPVPVERSRHPDVFISTYFTRAPGGRIPEVLVVHDLAYEDDPQLIGLLGDDPQTLTRKRACIAAAIEIVVPSEASAMALRHHYPWVTARVTVVPHGVEELFTATADDSADAAAAQLVARAGVRGPYLLHAGGRRAYKDFVTVLRLLAAERATAADLALVVVGSEPAPIDGEYELVEGVGTSRIVYLGHVPRRILAGLFRGSVAVVSASRKEGFGLVPLEAAACAAPVVCTAIPSHLEALGDHMFSFPPGDVDAADAALTRALRSSHDQRLRSAIALRSRFTWQRSAALIEHVLRRAAERRELPSRH